MSAREAVYGEPPAALAAVSAGARQLSPLIPGAEAIEDLAEASLDRICILAPPGVLERRYVLAHALRTLSQDGELIALAPKTKGGARLARELADFGCEAHETARRHHRICRLRRPARPTGLAEAIAAGALRLDPRLGLWTQPGVFSWDRIDPGTALLSKYLDGLSGRGADLGCGIGLLAQGVLARAEVSHLVCLDIDRRAVAAALRNLVDPRVSVRQQDVRDLSAAPPGGDLGNLDFVVMNPPFHQAGREDRGLGVAFIAAAAACLRRGGVCRLVANIALPYEERLQGAFKAVRLPARSGGYKVLEAVR